jgi:hypothetical protein
VWTGLPAAALVRFRRSDAQRLASLRSRDRVAIVPSWLTALVAIVVASPLTAVETAPVAATLVTLAALTITALGVRLARQPAVLTGDDPAVEEFVDERVRVARATALFVMATVPPFLFSLLLWLSGPIGAQAFRVHIAVTVATFCIFQLGLLALLRETHRAPDSAQLTRWARAGA